MLSNRKRRYKALNKYLCWWAGEHPDRMVAKEHKHSANRYDRRKAKQSLSKVFKNI
jgi:hypothetical protein